MEPITGIAIVDWALSLLDQWGYGLVYAFTVFENLFIIGSFTPGETVVMAASFMAVPGRGSLNVALVWIASFLGTVTGSNLSYWLGRIGGRDMLLKIGRRFRVDEARISAAEEYFFRHGSKTVFLSRFAAGFKNFVPMIAGVSKMHLGYFEGWTMVGAAVYTSIMVAIGFFVGENFDRALEIAANLGWIGMLLFIVVIGGAVWLRRRAEKNKIEELSSEREEVQDALHELDKKYGDSADDES